LVVWRVARSCSGETHHSPRCKRLEIVPGFGPPDISGATSSCSQVRLSVLQIIIDFQRRCDQAMLVRKEREVRCPSRNTEASSNGCESRPIRPARQVGSEPCDGHAGERVEAGRQRARRCIRHASERAVRSQPRKGISVPSVQGISLPEDHAADHHPMAQDGDGLGGVSVHGAFEEDDPVTWDTRALGGDTGGRRRGRPKSGPACVAGGGGALYER
jgi:hypothetical protein